RRIKMEIATIPEALATLSRVRPVTFRYTEEYRQAHPSIRDERYFNVIAQEFREVFPDAVHGGGDRMPDGSEILQVDTYPALITTTSGARSDPRTSTPSRKRRRRPPHRRCRAHRKGEPRMAQLTRIGVKSVAHPTPAVPRRFVAKVGLASRLPLCHRWPDP